MYYNYIMTVQPYIQNFILNYVVFINAFYAFVKTQKITLSKKRIIIIFIINVFISIIYSTLIVQDIIAISQTISYVGIMLSFLLVNNKNKSLIIGLISICYAHVLKTASFFISSVIIYSIFGAVLNIIPYVISCIISLVINYLFMKIKRIRNGIIFFEKSENLGIGLILSGMIFLISAVGYEIISNRIIVVVITFGIAISGFGLYLWIRKGITKHYREKLQLKSELYYKEQLEQKEQEIEKLNHSNEYLAKIVHRDNHLMSALDSSINAYFESGDRDFKDDILRKIQTLEIERAELINNEQRDSKILSTTGNTLIDGAINNLYIKAAAHGIDFNLSVSATVDEVIGKYISQTDLQTLICDHIKDAIIAVDAKNENNGKILAELSMENDNYTISIFDSGVDFEIDTLAKLGKERVTTHADNGGSGIGFMTTFETIRKSYASLIITEFENKTPFSKSVSIRFDGNTAFIIQSYRKEELKSVLTRDDVILL